MSLTVRRVFAGLTRVSLSGGILIHKAAPTVRFNSVRLLALSSQRSARSKKSTDGEENNNKPIKFSTSKASHRTWKVDRSMGSEFQRPLWKVLSISLLATAFLLWCTLRHNTNIDTHLQMQLHEHLPSLLSDEEEAETKNKPS
ncbi:protein CCSMST1 [Anabas testudineus]|uniref:Uncharacterized protein n=1 Tax=Anabas testudineus TaxID=64144 RepID=A0A3Q1IT52_ANATE|nr:protein CCSMST1 [Anabas testudineus]